MKKVLASIGALLLLAGCQSTPAASTIGNASVTFSPRIIEGARTVQAVVNPYAAGDINHVTLTLFKIEGGSPVQKATKDVTNLSAAVTFSNLNYQSDYRIQAVAYASSDSSSKLSVDSESVTDFSVEMNDAINLGTLPVQLIDRLFQGGASGTGINVLQGGFGHSGNEAIN